MKFWYDCEFVEDGFTIDLISIGIVCEDGRELYLQSGEFNIYNTNEWVKENVFPHLKQCPHTLKNGMQSAHPHGNNVTTDLLWQLVDHKIVGGQCTFTDPEKSIIGAHADCPWRTRSQIKYEIIDFLTTGYKIELWSYYGAYDHVAFCQLFGKMIDLPKGYPMYTRDLKQWCDMLGNPQLPKQTEGEHNAIADARHNKVMWEFLNGYSTTQEQEA